MKQLQKDVDSISATLQHNTSSIASMQNNLTMLLSRTAAGGRVSMPAYDAGSGDGYGMDGEMGGMSGSGSGGGSGAGGGGGIGGPMQLRNPHSLASLQPSHIPFGDTSSSSSSLGMVRYTTSTSQASPTLPGMYHVNPHLLQQQQQQQHHQQQQQQQQQLIQQQQQQQHLSRMNFASHRQLMPHQPHHPSSSSSSASASSNTYGGAPSGLDNPANKMGGDTLEGRSIAEAASAALLMVSQPPSSAAGMLLPTDKAITGSGLQGDTMEGDAQAPSTIDDGALHKRPRNGAPAGAPVL